MEVSSDLQAPAALSPAPIGREAGWAPEPVGSCGEEKSFFPLPGIEPRPSSPQFVAIRLLLLHERAQWVYVSLYHYDGSANTSIPTHVIRLEMPT
jgi:hypothetical protein